MFAADICDGQRPPLQQNMILRSRMLVTMEGAPIENGAVAITGDRIVDVGRFAEVKARISDQILDLGESILLPGLINAHCHLDYTSLRGKIAPQKSFTDWIRKINSAKQNMSERDYVASISAGFSESRKFGTTTVLNLEVVPELISMMEPPPLRTWWFGELLDIRDPARSDVLVDTAVASLKQCEHWGLAPHSPYTASARLYEQCENVAARDNILLTTHLSESDEESSMFQEDSGPLRDFLHQLGRDMSDCGQATPLGRFLEVTESVATRFLSGHNRKPKWIVAHLNGLSESDFIRLENAGCPFHVVHCPRSHEYFRHSAFPFERLGRLGLNICLGTDSLASNDDLSLFREMRLFQKKHPDVSGADILRMTTVHPARALDQSMVLGKISPQYYADLITIPHINDADVFEQIIAFDKAVGWSMVAGTNILG
ncbi:MAG: aminodeoxyfutalosine deaminase [Verrucomicrobiota bacterium]